MKTSLLTSKTAKWVSETVSDRNFLKTRFKQ